MELILAVYALFCVFVLVVGWVCDRLPFNPARLLSREKDER